jgi:limonene-1,2-epoxide hydrolase
MGTAESRKRQVVERYWDAHFRRDWERMATFFTPTSHYTDVGIDAEGATGPEEIILRLRLGIEPLSVYEHLPRHMIAEGNLVVTEHVERWGFPTGEVIDHPFTSVMEVHAGTITRWHDYSHLGNLLDNAPAWWIGHIANGWRNGIPALPPEATTPL